MPPVDWTISEGPILYLIGATFLALLGIFIAKQNDKAKAKANTITHVERAPRTQPKPSLPKWPDNSFAFVGDTAYEYLSGLDVLQRKITKTKNPVKLLVQEKELIQQFEFQYFSLSTLRPVEYEQDSEVTVIYPLLIRSMKKMVSREKKLLDSGFPVRETTFIPRNVQYDPSRRPAQLRVIETYLFQLEKYLDSLNGDEENIEIYE